MPNIKRRLLLEQRLLLKILFFMEKKGMVGSVGLQERYNENKLLVVRTYPVRNSDMFYILIVKTKPVLLVDLSFFFNSNM